MINREDIDNLTNDEVSEDVLIRTLEIARMIESLGLVDSAGFKNLNAIKDYTTTTREMFRALQVENDLYKNQIKQQNLVLEQMRTQIQQLQVKLYTKNATG